MDETDMDEAMKTILAVTRSVVTPETNANYGGVHSVWVYSIGMMELYGIPDLEFRGVPGVFAVDAQRKVNEINAYRLHNLQNDGPPVLEGQTVRWDGVMMRVAKADAWDGMYTWTEDEMFRIDSMALDFSQCECCKDEHS